MLMLIAPDRFKLTLERIIDRVRSNAQSALHRTVPATLSPPPSLGPTPAPTLVTTQSFAVPQRQYRTPAPRSEDDQQRWALAELRCRSQPPITGKDAFKLLNMARRLSEANDEADRCWSLALALPGGEDYLPEAPQALMSSDTNWSEIYRNRFVAHDRERQQLQEQADALIRDLCRTHYNESDCVSFSEDETGEQHLCPLSLGNPSSTGAR
jgi:hypothetical protein